MKQIKMQFAMDGAASRTLEQALKMVGDVAAYVDIVEVGTSFVLRYGMEAVKAMKQAFPEKEILADMKIMDGGYHNTALGCHAGGDIVTILGVSDAATIRGAIKACHDNGKQAMVDLICVQDKARVIALCEAVGADYICAHSGVDVQQAGQNPYADLSEIIGLVKTCKVAVAGGLDEQTAEDICKLGPDVVIVGGAIHKAADCGQVAANIRAIIDRVAQSL